MTTPFEDLESLVPDFQYVDTDHNRVVLTVGLRATFYFWMGHKSNIRASIIECAEAFEAAYGENLIWGFHPDLQKRVDLKDGKLPPLRQYVASLDENDSIEWYVSSGEDDEAAGEYKLEIQTERGWQEGEISTFNFTLPREHAFHKEKKSKFLSLFQLCTEKLKPFHGHAGLAAISSYDQEDWQSEELDVSTRYYGLYIEPTFIDANHAPNGLKSVDWLNFVGKTLAERVGGLNALSERLLTLGMDLNVGSHGLVIATGPTPDIAPVEQGLPPTLANLNAVLRPLRNGAFGSMGFGSVNGELRFTRCTSDLWIRRLDKPGIWPPASFVGLGKVPLGKAPLKKVNIKTGDRSPVYGRFQRTAAEKPELVLMPGDVAPYWIKLGPHGEYLGRDAVAWELVAEL